MLAVASTKFYFNQPALFRDRDRGDPPAAHPAAGAGAILTKHEFVFSCDNRLR